MQTLPSKKGKEEESRTYKKWRSKSEPLTSSCYNCILQKHPVLSLLPDTSILPAKFPFQARPTFYHPMQERVHLLPIQCREQLGISLIYFL